MFEFQRRSGQGRALFSAILSTAFAAAAWAGSSVPQVEAAGYHTMHRFQKATGSGPDAELVRGADGALYGTNFHGGELNAGTVYRITTDNQFSVLHTFTGSDGSAPATALAIGADGAFYGLTGGGGEYGGGTAFRLTVGGVFTLLHSFGGSVGDGAYPYLGVMAQASDGNFYGATMQGGAAGLGAAFRMTPAGAVTVLHPFAGGVDDGAMPRGQLVLGSDGRLYGVATCGGVRASGRGCGGVVYRLALDGSFDVLHRFQPADAPQGALLASDGSLYGTTSHGGTRGFGTVFRMALDGTGFTTLHDFAGGVGGRPINADGAVPTGRLLRASDGNFYGTTSQGGSNASIDPNGDGTIYAITPAGAYAVVHTFGANPNDGARPFAGLTQGLDGLLYGTTHNGSYQSDGTVFKLALPAL